MISTISEPDIIARLDYAYLLISLQTHMDYEKWLAANCLHLVAYHERDALEINFCGHNYSTMGYESPMLIRENAIFSIESNSSDNARAYLRQLLHMDQKGTKYYKEYEFISKVDWKFKDWLADDQFIKK